MPEAEATKRQQAGKGASFFKRAEEVAGTGNWDFAIEMYLEGISREPDNLDRGHKPLRDAALKRKLQGGKGPGLKDTLKRRQGKDPLVNLINAEYLLAKEPGSVQYMERLLSAAMKLELKDVALWVCDILLEAQRQAKKASKRILLLLIKTYRDFEAYGRAIQSCQAALELSPEDGDLQQSLNDLSADYTIQKGKYDQEGDFTQSVKDLEKQKDLIQKDSLVQTSAYLEEQIARARGEYEKSPAVAGKVNAYVDALLKVEQDSYENEAIDVLAKAHKDTGSYQFKVRVGDVKMRQMTRRYRKLTASGDKQAALKHAKEQLEFELKEYQERAKNYPTDLAIKFELGRRQLLAGRHDDAIGSLQQAQRDPHRHLLALNYLGQAFAAKGWVREAADTYQRALSSEMPEPAEKELRYNLGDVLMKLEQYEQAREQFSNLAQIDYNFKDVRERIETIDEKLRKSETA
ncbi:MAG: tetratricopeptide repeat protein [Planctomycetota bacterium]|jgi:tetratricopeptide (TPR) repeat protein